MSSSIMLETLVLLLFLLSFPQGISPPFQPQTVPVAPVPSSSTATNIRRAVSLLQHPTPTVVGMLLSFVVPAYNEEAYLPDCIESILRETAGLEELTEIIVVDNASTDRTREVAERYARVYVVDEPRKGLTHARQAGFLASSGTLIANVDSDSLLPPGWVERVLQEFRRDDGLVTLSGPLHYYDLSPQQRRAVWVFYGLAWATYAMNRYVLRVGSMVQGGNFVVSRAALEGIGGFNLGISFYGEDTDIARRMHQVGKVLFTFDLKMHSSARRLKHEGMVTMAAKYSLNYFWTTFFKRPYTAEHIDIRDGALSRTVRE